MINLFPPSPVASQIDTTFLRSEPIEAREDDGAQFEVPTVREKSRPPRATDEATPDEESDRTSAEKVEDDKPKADDQVQTLLELISQHAPKKKPVSESVATADQPVKVDPETSHDASSTVAAAGIVQTPTLNVPSKSDTQPEKVLSVAEQTAAAGSVQNSQQIVSDLAPQTTSVKSLEELNFSALQQMALEARTSEEPTTDAADLAATPITRASVSADELPEISVVETTLPAEVPGDIAIEIVSTSAAPEPPVSANRSELQTTFISADFASDRNATVPVERDELTRQIEQMIARSIEPTGNSTATVDSGVVEFSIALPDSVDLTTTLPEPNNTSAVADPGPVDFVNVEEIGLPAQSHRQQGGAESSLNQSDDQESPSSRIQSAATLNTSSSASAWSQASGIASTLTSSVQAEIREPLSSQAARAILTHLETKSNDEPETLTVRLDPPELGEMTIELSKTREGLAVRVTARESVTMDMLLARGQEIEQHLKNNQVDVASMEFVASGNSGGPNSRQNRGSESQEQFASQSATRQSGQSSRSGSNAPRAVGTAIDRSQPLSFRA